MVLSGISYKDRTFTEGFLLAGSNACPKYIKLSTKETREESLLPHILKAFYLL